MKPKAHLQAALARCDSLGQLYAKYQVKGITSFSVTPEANSLIRPARARHPADPGRAASAAR